MIRHILVEGMDGTGKSTLIDTLLYRFPEFKPAPKASRSKEGPVDQLDHWVMNDLHQQEFSGPYIYDRHPLISEPIYGPICRGGVPGMFNQQWWLMSRTAMLARHCLLVYCVPPLRVVRDNVQRSEDNQMKGVIEHADELYWAYSRMSNRWPGVQLRHDYTIQHVNDVVRYIENSLKGMRTCG